MAWTLADTAMPGGGTSSTSMGVDRSAETVAGQWMVSTRGGMGVMVGVGARVELGVGVNVGTYVKASVGGGVVGTQAASSRSAT